jgi:cytochrome c oxidase cbb3-type subunit 2
MWRSGRGAGVALAVLVVASVACGRGESHDDAASGAGTPDARARGEAVYALRCSPCHGAGGGGDGPAAAAIVPKPRNFHDPDFWRGRTVDQLRLVVKQGKPGTLMPPFDGVLSGPEIDDVLAYVQTFRPQAP